jgi:hypothetical protein
MALTTSAQLIALLACLILCMISQHSTRSCYHCFYIAAGNLSVKISVGWNRFQPLCVRICGNSDFRYFREEAGAMPGKHSGTRIKPLAVGFGQVSIPDCCTRTGAFFYWGMGVYVFNRLASKTKTDT